MDSINNDQPKAKMYFIAIVLPPHLDETIRGFKKQMQESYGCKVGLKSPAHITLAPPFWMEEEKEESLRQDMATIAQKVTTFTLNTEDFSAFKPRTIFVALQKSEELDRVKKSSDDFFRHTDYKMKIENRPFHPHITIATRDLHKKHFAEAWPRFEKGTFRESFDAMGLSLLKHNGRAWDVVFMAPFTAGPGEGSAPQL